MPYSTFPLTYGPVFPVERTKQPRLNVSNYGDGYEQASGDGINIIKPDISVSWTGLTQAESQSCDTYITGLGGITPFMWTYPGDGAQTQYVCRKWKAYFIGPNNYGFDATFTTNFNP